jgi:hypothetical protein
MQSMLTLFKWLRGVCLQPLRSHLGARTAPNTTWLLLGFLRDLTRSKSELEEEHARLREELKQLMEQGPGWVEEEV